LRDSPLQAPRRGLSVTLLDGTTITLPGGRPDAAPADPGAAVGDLIAALRAAARVADARGGPRADVRWERMFAALLAILVRKGLVTHREFLEELEKG
jgi:hypothetical protein